MGAQDEQRLINAGVDHEALGGLDLRLLAGPFPDGWTERGNRILVDASVPIPEALLPSILQGDSTDALVCVAADISDAAYLLIDGRAATVFIGAGTRLPQGELHCGDSSALLLLGAVTCTARPTIDARNGGSIIAEHDQLWASDVIVSTDDMHAIRDVETGDRINAFGASIWFGQHVWLGRDAFVAGGARIGAHTVVGARSLVRASQYPGHVVLAGTPARVVRQGITWERADLP